MLAKIVWSLIAIVVVALLAYRFETDPEQKMGRVYVVVSDGEVMEAKSVDREAGLAVYSPSRTIGLWLAAFFTIGVFSFLYNDNPYYKICEAVFVGVSAAYWMVLGFWTQLIPNLFGKLFPGWIQSWAMPGLSTVREADAIWYWGPMILGVMLLMRLSPKGSWMARWPLAFIIGTTAGLRLVNYLDADFVSQIQGMVANFVTLSEDAGSPDAKAMQLFWRFFAELVGMLGVLACLVYFFFSIEHKGTVDKVARGGIWVLMVTFGAAFGYTVMGRIALLAIRLEFLLQDWLAIVEPAAG